VSKATRVNKKLREVGHMTHNSHCWPWSVRQSQLFSEVIERDCNGVPEMRSCSREQLVDILMGMTNREERSSDLYKIPIMTRYSK